MKIIGFIALSLIVSLILPVPASAELPNDSASEYSSYKDGFLQVDRGAYEFDMNKVKLPNEAPKPIEGPGTYDEENATYVGREASTPSFENDGIEERRGVVSVTRPKSRPRELLVIELREAPSLPRSPASE